MNVSEAGVDLIDTGLSASLIEIRTTPYNVHNKSREVCFKKLTLFQEADAAHIAYISCWKFCCTFFLRPLSCVLAVF